VPSVAFVPFLLPFPLAIRSVDSERGDFRQLGRAFRALSRLDHLLLLAPVRLSLGRVSRGRRRDQLEPSFLNRLHTFKIVIGDALETRKLIDRLHKSFLLLTPATIAVLATVHGSREDKRTVPLPSAPS
jgi:hypothetical protein